MIPLTFFLNTIGESFVNYLYYTESDIRRENISRHCHYTLRYIVDKLDIPWDHCCVDLTPYFPVEEEGHQDARPKAWESWYILPDPNHLLIKNFSFVLEGYGKNVYLKIWEFVLGNEASQFPNNHRAIKLDDVMTANLLQTTSEVQFVTGG